MQRSLRNLYLGIAATGLLFSSAGTAQVVWPPAMRSPPNVTSDSEQGWLPSDKQIVDMQNTTDGFFAAKDDGRSADAYRHLADISTRHVPFDAFDKEIHAFNSLAGPLKERRVTTVTWTKNPSRAPTAGVYAALDIVAKFKDVDRDCGVLILYQSPLGGAFWVMREEKTALANATVRKMEAQQSQAAVDKLWAELSARCPNYPPELAALPEQTGNVIGYRTVDAALAALHTNPGVDFRCNPGGRSPTTRRHRHTGPLCRPVILPTRLPSSGRLLKPVLA